jgi:hypothetical protein
MAGKQTASSKKLSRSARDKHKNEIERPGKIRHARARHIKNAKQSCGPKFAERLEAYYAKNSAEKRHQGKKK